MDFDFGDKSLHVQGRKKKKKQNTNPKGSGILFDKPKKKRSLTFDNSKEDYDFGGRKKKQDSGWDLPKRKKKKSENLGWGNYGGYDDSVEGDSPKTKTQRRKKKSENLGWGNYGGYDDSSEGDSPKTKTISKERERRMLIQSEKKRKSMLLEKRKQRRTLITKTRRRPVDSGTSGWNVPKKKKRVVVKRTKRKTRSIKDSERSSRWDIPQRKKKKPDSFIQQGNWFDTPQIQKSRGGFNPNDPETWYQDQNQGGGNDPQWVITGGPLDEDDDVEMKDKD